MIIDQLKARLDGWLLRLGDHSGRWSAPAIKQIREFMSKHFDLIKDHAAVILANGGTADMAIDALRVFVKGNVHFLPWYLRIVMSESAMIDRIFDVAKNRKPQLLAGFGDLPTA